MKYFILRFCPIFSSCIPSVVIFLSFLASVICVLLLFFYIAVVIQAWALRMSPMVLSSVLAYILYLVLSELHGLWNLEAQCCIKKDSLIIPILVQINSTPKLKPVYLRSILILSSYVCSGIDRCLFPKELPLNILKAFVAFSILAAASDHLHLLYLIILTILAERYKLWSSSLWNLLHSPLPLVSYQNPVSKYP